MIVTVNGQMMQGQVFELKAGVAPEQAYQAGKGDGFDQVYFEADGKNYVLQGEGLDLKKITKSDIPFVQLHLDSKTAVRADVKAVDNETNTFLEGVWNWGTKGGLIGVGGGVGMMVIGPGLTSGPADHKLGAVFGGMSIAGAAALVAGISAVGGGLYGAFKGTDESQLAGMIKK